MSLSFELYVALRYLRSKRKEVFISIITIISVLGVALSVMVLNLVLAVMSGFERELQAKLINANAHLVVRKLNGYMDGWEDVSKKIRAVPGVSDVFPYTYNQAMITSPHGARGLIIRGIANSDSARSKLTEILERGTAIDDLFNPPAIEVERPDGSADSVTLPSVIVGAALSQTLHLVPGRPVSMFSPEMSASPQGLIPRARRFTVVGTYHSGLIEYETGLAYTSIESAQKFFSLGDSVTGIEVSVLDVFQAKAIGERIMEVLGGDRSGYFATDWGAQNKPLWDAFALEKRVYFIVLLLLILTASFSIISTLVMVVMEKSRDIALLKSLGATDRSVLGIFLIQGCVIGFVGVLTGTIFGYLGCIGLREYGFKIDQTVFGIDKVPVLLESSNFVVVAIAGFVITSLAGVYPARRAARLRPAEALRFE